MKKNSDWPKGADKTPETGKKNASLSSTSSEILAILPPVCRASLEMHFNDAWLTLPAQTQKRVRRCMNGKRDLESYVLHMVDGLGMLHFDSPHHSGSLRQLEILNFDLTTHLLRCGHKPTPEAYARGEVLAHLRTQNGLRQVPPNFQQLSVLGLTHYLLTGFLLLPKYRHIILQHRLWIFADADPMTTAQLAVRLGISHREASFTTERLTRMLREQLKFLYLLPDDSLLPYAEKDLVLLDAKETTLLNTRNQTVFTAPFLTLLLHLHFAPRFQVVGDPVKALDFSNADGRRKLYLVHRDIFEHPKFQIFLQRTRRHGGLRKSGKPGWTLEQLFPEKGQPVPEPEQLFLENGQPKPELELERRVQHVCKEVMRFQT